MNGAARLPGGLTVGDDWAELASRQGEFSSLEEMATDE